MSSASSARTSSQVPQSTGTSDTQYNVRDAALRGASLAFSKPPVKPKPPTNTYTGGSNGALLAATKVGTRPSTSQGTVSPLGRDWTGGSSTARMDRSPIKSSSSSTLGVPDDHTSDRAPSPSNIAAKLAAARYSPLKPNPQPSGKLEGSPRDVMPPIGSVSDVLARLQPKVSSQQAPRKQGSSTGSRSVTHVVPQPVENVATDDRPIPPTSSLVKMFEAARSTTPMSISAEPLIVSQTAPPPMQSPKPQRTIKVNIPNDPKTSVPSREIEVALTPQPVKAKPKPKPKPRALSMDGPEEGTPFVNFRRDTLNTTLAEEKVPQLTPAKSRPNPPPQRGSRQARPMSEDLTRSMSTRGRIPSSMSVHSTASSNSAYVSAPEEQEREQVKEKPKPTLPPPRRSRTLKTEGAQTEARPKTAPAPPRPQTPSRTKIPHTKPEEPTLLPKRPTEGLQASLSSDTLFRSNYQRESAKQVAKHLTGESLSNAYVGAALASRISSPGPPPAALAAAPPLPTRRHHHHHHPHLHLNRSPSPQKHQKPPGKLRSTLRKEPSSSSDEDESEKYRKKGTRIMGMRKKHPNKHHEGTRKRWRDTITDRERKRYEGVWAANKGLYISTAERRSPSRGSQAEDPSSDVLNLVVKEIWMRSRLPDHVLEEVWDLVDGRGVGRLCKEEFVVGMWLIDQRLKGRKLPFKVSDSVWMSVRGAGVKVKVRPRK